MHHIERGAPTSSHHGSMISQSTGTSKQMQTWFCGSRLWSMLPHCYIWYSVPYHAKQLHLDFSLSLPLSLRSQVKLPCLKTFTRYDASDKTSCCWGRYNSWIWAYRSISGEYVRPVSSSSQPLSDHVVVCSDSLYGISCLQTFNYFLKFGNDRIGLKVYVSPFISVSFSAYLFPFTGCDSFLPGHCSNRSCMLHDILVRYLSFICGRTCWATAFAVNEGI